MDDNAPKENPPADFNKLDLTQLQGFSFGTQWTQEKPSAPERRDRGEGERPRREDRREGGAGPDRRDRRMFKRPAGSDLGASPAGGAGGGERPAPERREFSGDRGPRRDDRREGGGGGFRGGPRRDGPGGDRGPRFGHGGQGGYGRGAPIERGPYDSPYFSVTFYPEDTSFNTLVQTIRKSCRTVELFEIARTVVAKSDRFVVVVTPKGPGAETRGPVGAKPAAPAAAPAPVEAAAPKPKQLFYISVPDGMPFESDEAAVSHVLSKHLDKFFDTAEVEIDPPKGNFQVINKCGVTGELLGPPNYHRYNQIVQQHYTARLASRMSIEAFRTRVETIRDPEVVNQWLAKMKKTTRYTWKLGAKPAAVVAPAEATPAAEGSAPVEVAPEAAPAAPATPVFDTLEDARLYLLTNAREKVVRTTESARFHGKLLETMPPGEIKRAVEGALQRQQRFPLDTANALRGRLRREHFTIFKKGSKGVSYVCAVKRKFRVPGQTFSDTIGALIAFIEASPMVRASELPVKFLGIRHPVVAAKPAEAAPAPAAAAGETAPAEGAAPVAAPAPAEPMLSIDDRARISRMQGDLMWLVREGYVTEFIDGRLFAPPPMVEARKKEVESEEHDPENFPEAPVETPATSFAPAEAPAQPEVAAPAETAAPQDASAAAEPAAPSEASAPAEPAASTPSTESAPAAEPAAPTAPSSDEKPAGS